ncbi:MAG: LysR family transcriptional regulator [Pseudomonas sp.]|uniref:LysR family transcriptional regulator n=1 Tax=Pseudomonas sp. TaxID=306 RepID=UPI003982C467
MNLRNVDLNLLLVFHAMIEHRSVTRAAESIGLSQPATSAALNRLRSLLGDPLFVKAGTEMHPTPRATELIQPVQLIMETIKGHILPSAAFDASTTDRQFHILTPDIGEINFLPKLLNHLATHAPNARLKTMSMPKHTAAEALESGIVDLAMGYFPDLQKAGFFQQRLFCNEYVCILRRDHPDIGQTMTLEQFLSAKHAVVQPEGREHLFEKFLLAEGVKRTVQLEVSHFMSLLPIISTSDLVATVPHDLAQACIRFGNGNMRMLPSPIKAPVIELQQLWHRRYHKDAAHTWLRTSIHSLFSAE